MNRLVVAELNSASIKIIKNGTVLATPFLNINPRSEATEAQRGSIVKFYYSRSNGSMTVSSGIWKGKTLSMRDPVSLGYAVADSTEKATIHIVDKAINRWLYLRRVFPVFQMRRVYNR